MRRVLFALTCLLVPTHVHAADTPAFADAALFAVQFIDANEGWAAGDDGVVWHTIDGGQSWERQPTGVRACLRSLHFLDPFVGYVVGRESLPHGTGSTGVILATRDGGVSWQRLNMKTLPGLNRVKFLDKQNGFVAGDGSDQFPSGAFFTQDGGKSWHMLPSPPWGRGLGERGGEGVRTPLLASKQWHAASWLAADFLDPRTGILVGAWGRLGPVREREVVGPDIDLSLLRGRNIRAVQLEGKTAFAVGDGGLALISEETAGKRWGAMDLGLPADLQGCWDFHGLHFIGDNGWIVGRPGSVILHTADRGKTWDWQRTGQSLPLHHVFFLNDQQGWAVGELGTIVATNDGGTTWKVQQRGGHRAAALIVTAKGENVPAPVVALLGGDEGYLTVATQVTAADPHSAAPGRSAEAMRLREAIRQAGGCAAEVLWSFPLPGHLAQADAATLARFWGSSNDENRGLEQLERALVLTLRIWKPEVVLTDNPDPRTATGQPGAAVGLAIQRAIQKAGRAEAYPEQVAKLDLQPWSPKKLYARCENANGAHVTIDLNEAKPRLNGSAVDFAAPAASLLNDAPAATDNLAPFVHYRLLASTLVDADKHKWLMQGLSLQPGGQARRELGDPAEFEEVDLKRLAQAVQQRRDLQAIAKQQLQDPVRAARMLAVVEPALAGLPEEQAGGTAFNLANQFAQAGQWPMAKEVFLLMIDRYPAHRLAPDACRWLIRHGASSEARRREELGQFHVTTEYKFRPRQTSSDSQRFTQIQREREIALLRRWEDVRTWHKGSLTVGEHLAALSMVHFLEPEVQSCLQSARRSLGDFHEAQKWYAQMKLKLGEQGGPWAQAAAAELWLVNRDGLPPKPMASCARTDHAPFLDGKLDDPCWKQAKAINLKDAVNQTAEAYPTEVWLAYDADCLYLAARCKHPADGHRKPPVTPRPRDADLRAFDRISLLLDLDRDYSTFFHLQIDQRGCVCEDCWGDKSWNPKWYVAIESDDTSWTVEAAIPLVELTGDKQSFGTTWACNLVRTIPGKGVQAMNTPADAEPRPEGMGLLTFIQTERKRPTGQGNGR